MAITNEIEGLTETEFARLFSKLHSRMLEDPIKNFIEPEHLLGFTPTLAQRVVLKTVFHIPLNHDTAMVRIERAGMEGEFLLVESEQSEISLYEEMTGIPYDPGAVDVNQVNLIIGRRAGKCQSAESLITLYGGERRIASSLVGETFEVLAYDAKTGKSERARAVGFDNGVKELVRITTKSGFALDRTLNHQLLTDEGWKSFDEGLSAGHHIQVPRINDQFGNIQAFTDEEIKFLGYMIGDGTHTDNGVGYTQIPGLCSDEFSDIITSYFGGRLRTYKKVDGPAVDFRWALSQKPRDLLKLTGLWNKRSHHKFVPEAIFTSPKRQIALFLNRLFSTDGSLYDHSGGRICFEYCSVSKQLADQVKHLLHRFGVFSVLRKKEVCYKGGRNTAYLVETSDYRSVKIIAEEIGILGKDHKFIEKGHNPKSANHYSNVFPKSIWAKITEEQKRQSLTDAEVVYGVGHRSTSADFERLRRQYAPNKEKILKYFDNLGIGGVRKTIVEDFWFDEIVSIERIGPAPTVGIEVEKYHTYINDVVEHNSTMSVIIALLIALKINWKPYLRKTPVATVAILSHSVDLSKDILDIFKEFVDNSPLLTRLMSKKRKNTQNEFNLAIPFFVDKKGKETLIYSEVSFKVGAASKKTTRGRAVCAALCDEIAYWNLDEKAAESDADVLRALRPSLGQFKEHGMLLKLSSPAIKQGVLYDEWERRVELKDQIVQFKAPSWVCNNIVDFDFYQKEWRLDENNFDTEYRANFVESISSFIPPEHVDECVASGITIIPPFEKNRHSVYSAAIDAAFKSDRFAFTIVANHEGQLTQHSALLWENSKQNPSSAFEIAETISNVCEQYGISRVYADQFAFQPLKEIFERHNISLQENTFTLAYKKKIYYALRQVIKDKKIRLLDSQIQTRELKELEVSQSPTGHIKIGHPRGGSDDAADALATATFMALQKGQSFKMTSTAQVDVKAGAFETLKQQNDLEIFDNTGLYRQNPETKEWEVRPDLEDDNFTFNF